MGGGGLIAAIALAVTLGGGNDSAESNIELVRPSLDASRPPQTVAPVVAAAQAPAQPAVPSASLEGIRLHGIMSGGAVVAVPGRGQRLVRLGRELLPGVTLAELRQDRIVLAHGGSTTELSFIGEGQAQESQAQAAAGPAPPAVAPGTPDARRQALEYRLGLAPQRVGGRTVGFAVRPGANLPVLQRAGLRPGDIIVSVNGQSFDSEEKVLELPSEIAGSYTAEFEIERQGRRMRLSLPVNPRPSQ